MPPYYAGENGRDDFAAPAGRHRHKERVGGRDYLGTVIGKIKKSEKQAFFGFVSSL